MTDDRIGQAEQKLDEAHRALKRVQGTTGVIITETNLEAVIEAVRLLASELREIRDGGDEDLPWDGGIDVFDTTPPV